MADWRGVSEGISRGFERGVATGGKLSALGSVLGKVADKLKSDRLAKEEMGQKQNLLGYASTLKMKEAEAEAALKPKTEAIVSDTGEVVGSRPVGAVFQPRPDPTEAIIAALGGGMPKPKIPAKIEPTNNKVLVINPDGKKGYIPKSQLQEALDSGYRRAIK